MWLASGDVPMRRSVCCVGLHATMPGGEVSHLPDLDRPNVIGIAAPRTLRGSHDLLGISRCRDLKSGALRGQGVFAILQ